MRGLLRALALFATAFAILAGGSLGFLLPLAALQWLKAPLGIQGSTALIGGIAGIVGAYMLGDRVNSRIGRLRAPIGSAAIGSDGIRWRHFGKTEFLGWARVRDVILRGRELVVLVEGGADIMLPLQQPELFVSAARDALKRYRDGAPSPTLAALEFAGEDVAGWLARARELLQAGSYREADVGEENCVRIATDPRAPLAQRVGSAAALSKASEDARQRVRVAIEDTADPVVANALENALDERDNPRKLASILRR